ncbi:MAG: FcoT family thioesterase [Nanoarchaeota archaeon]
MKISQELVDKVVAVYKPNYRYLKEADVNFPVARGIFQLGETEYMQTLQHLTDVEAQLCLNQLSYVFFGNEINAKRWEGLRDLTFDDYLELRKEGMFIVESHKKFHKETNPREPFEGIMRLVRAKKRGNIYLATLDFNLNNGACIGDLSLVLKR